MAAPESIGEDGARRAGGAGGVDDIVDLAIRLGPEAARRRLVLHDLDWAKAGPERVGALLAAFKAAGKPVPPWLLRLLIIAGHAVEPADAQRTPRALQVLDQLNQRARADGTPTGDAKQAPSAFELGDDVEPEIVRTLAERLVVCGDAAQACRLALAHWWKSPAVLRPVRDALPAYTGALPGAKFHIAGFSTTNVLAEDLKTAGAASGWQVAATQASFGEVVQTLLAPRPDADAQILLLDAPSVMERDWRQPSGDSLASLESWAGAIVDAIRAYAARTQAPLLVNTLPVPALPTAGWIDARHGLGARRAVDLVNERLIGLAREVPSLHLVDADQAMAHIAPTSRVDAKLWYYGRVAYGADASRALARGFAQLWASLKRGPAKVVAVDLDNTLWGGVFGDDGIERLVCGEEAPGNAFQALHRECLRLKRQGMLLVALSKNNPDAIGVFDAHPGMLLKATDFAATAINWEPKPENLKRIASELRLGLDSFVFIDDSPHEREAMRQLLPQVAVPEMPDDPAARPEWLRRLAVTWPVRLTEEDERRNESYAAEAQAKALKGSAATMADYLAGLEQHLIVAAVTPQTLPRIAQMHQRTNQFNLTTRRSSEAEIAALMDDPAKGLALQGRARDKFGDHGITIAATAAIRGEEAEIVTFLMSCRVIGREVEHAFLGAVLGELASRGVKRVIGAYIPSPKNQQVAGFYPAAGFKPLASDPAGSQWAFVIGAGELPASRHVRVTWEA